MGKLMGNIIVEIEIFIPGKCALFSIFLIIHPSIQFYILYSVFQFLRFVKISTLMTL